MEAQWQTAVDARGFDAPSLVVQTRVCGSQESMQRELITAQGVAFDALCLLIIPENA
jgi:hypothetical protein